MSRKLQTRRNEDETETSNGATIAIFVIVVILLLVIVYAINKLFKDRNQIIEEEKRIKE